jgi:hypothetical protein
VDLLKIGTILLNQKYYNFHFKYLLGLSLLQNGPIPKLPEDQLQEIFIKASPKRGFLEIRQAYQDLGIYQVTVLLRVL